MPQFKVIRYCPGLLPLLLLLLLVTNGNVAGEKLQLSNCSQISNYHDKRSSKCDMAMDGKPQQLSTVKPKYPLSCTHTKWELQPWWTAEFKPALVTAVRISNRQDCCSDRLNHFVIKVNGKVCAKHDSNTPFTVKTFACDAVGSVVRIEKTEKSKSFLTLCEVEVFGTRLPMPKGKELKLSNCQQSSTYQNRADMQCGNALVDNTTICTHTQWEFYPWWTAQFTPALITSVKIFNRVDCCSDGLNHFVIKIDGKECARYESDKSFKVKTFDCNAVGSVVMIEPTITSKSFLTLCKVELVGMELARPKGGKKLELLFCKQSSLAGRNFCEKAMIGYNDAISSTHSCSRTKPEVKPWLTQLVERAKITAVMIYGSIDCCADAMQKLQVKIGDKHLCKFHQKSHGVQIFTCNSIGTEVKITAMNNNKVQLGVCAIEVYGEP